MKKIIISVMLAFPASLMAQNLDPTVEVSREYEGKLIEVHKPSLTMAVPDTLYRFDLDFDYSVFDSPYRGSYEFTPYVLDMRPSSTETGGKVFYLNAGAGYTLHPALDVLWSPVRKGDFSVDVYGRHRSYVGEYRGSGQRPAWNGYDLLSQAGADFGYDWKKAAVDFGASYYGVADKDYRRTRAYNALDAYASLKSKMSGPEHFMYDVSLAYRFAQDDSDAFKPLAGHEFKVDVSFGPGFGSAGRLLVDVGVELDSYGGAFRSSAGRFCFAPHYLYRKGIFRLDAGVRVSAILNAGEAFKDRGQYVYPDIRMSVGVIPDAMKLYLHLGGGDKIDTYSSLLAGNHHVDIGYGLDGIASLMNVTVERISAILGLEGRISSCFSYNLRGGYVNYGRALLDAVRSGDDGLLLPAVGYAPYEKWIAALDWNLDVQSLRFDGSVSYGSFHGLENADMLLPAVFEADASVVYNWNRRIYAGLDCAYATSRKSKSGFVVPWYVDLGVYAEYALNRKVSFWLRGGNLLDMEIQRNLMYAEKGVNFTAGICLSL